MDIEQFCQNPIKYHILCLVMGNFKSLQQVSDFYGEEYDTVLPVLMSRIQYCQSPTLREELTQLKRETKLHTILNEDM